MHAVHPSAMHCIPVLLTHQEQGALVQILPTPGEHWAARWPRCSSLAVTCSPCLVLGLGCLPPLCPAGGTARGTAEHLVFRQRACLAREGLCRLHAPTSPLLAQAWPRGLSWHGLARGTERGTSAVAGGVPAPLGCARSIPWAPCHPTALPPPGKASQGTVEDAPGLGPSHMGETRSPAQHWCALLCQDWGCRAR